MPKHKRSGRRTISVSSRSNKISATSRGKKRKKKSTAGDSSKKSKVTTIKQKSMALEEMSKRNLPALIRLAKKMGNRFVDTVHGRKARKTVVRFFRVLRSLSLSLYVRNVLNINVHAGEEEEEHAEEEERSAAECVRRKRYGDRIMDIVSKINK